MSQAHFSAPEGEGLIKWLGLSLKLHPALSSTLELEALVDSTWDIMLQI